MILDNSNLLHDHQEFVISSARSAHLDLPRAVMHDHNMPSNGSGFDNSWVQYVSSKLLKIQWSYTKSIRRPCEALSIFFGSLRRWLDSYCLVFCLIGTRNSINLRTLAFRTKNLANLISSFLASEVSQYYFLEMCIKAQDSFSTIIQLFFARMICYE